MRRAGTPEVMAALRSAGIGPLPTLGATNIAAAGRRPAAQPAAGLALPGIALLGIAVDS